MASYCNFAYFYDELNQAADYDMLFGRLFFELKAQGIYDGIVADLGCGTAEISLRLAAAGYDVVAVDASPDMLSVAREKAYEQKQPSVLFLHQSLAELDLYGTIRAAVSTFDTVNHLTPAELAEAVRRVALFMEKDGLFIFDANTPYKHEEILAGNTFVVETEDGLSCRWQNEYLPNQKATSILLQVDCDERRICEEIFLEYAYPQQDLRKLLESNQFEIIKIIDGETWGNLSAESQRYLFVARKTAQPQTGEIYEE